MSHAIHCVKCPYSELSWSVFSHIRMQTDSEYLSEFSPNAGKYRPEVTLPEILCSNFKKTRGFFQMVLDKYLSHFYPENQSQWIHFVDSPSIRCRNSTWKVCRYFIDFERQIHVEIMTLILDSTWKFPRAFDFQNWRNIDEFSTWIFLFCFDVESM